MKFRRVLCPQLAQMIQTWSAVTPGGSYMGNLGYAPPMPAQDLSSHAHPFENTKIPLPAGVDSVREWDGFNVGI